MDEGGKRSFVMHVALWERPIFSSGLLQPVNDDYDGVSISIRVNE